MSTTTSPAVITSAGGRAVVMSAVSGIGGGIVFGIMMAMMGMLPMVAMLVGRTDPVTGWVVHLLISAAFGAAYGLATVVLKLPLTNPVGLIAGAVAGVVFWVAGALIAMPLMLGMTEMVFQVGQPQIMSLIGHLIYGVITGVGLVRLLAR
jgi:uncharacterized membrane protein YagU involved in acid resistance